MHRFPRIREPEREQVALREHARQHDPHVPEVNLSLSARLVRLRDEHLRRTPALLDPDLRTAPPDVIAHGGIGDPFHLVLGHQPVEDPLYRVPLLARRIQVRPQHLIDSRLERIQAGLARRQLLARRRPRRRQRLPHQPPVHLVLPRQSAHRQALRPGIPADRREQLDLGLRRHKRPLTLGTPILPPQDQRWGHNSPNPPHPHHGWGQRRPTGGAGTHPPSLIRDRDEPSVVLGTKIEG